MANNHKRQKIRAGDMIIQNKRHRWYELVNPSETLDQIIHALLPAANAFVGLVQKWSAIFSMMTIGGEHDDD